MNKVLHIDCMEYMKTVPDKFFDLAVVDPPYGGGSKSDESSEIAGGGRTLREGNAPASAVGLISTISNAHRQRATGCLLPR